MPFAQRSHADDGGIICRYTGGCRACWRERQTSTPLVDKQKGICDLKQKAAMALRLVSCRLAE
ncbi:hypothetical protein A0118_RS19510 [Acinetobacter baumannii]|uniref:Uncharacterized protein n=3 Tax=Enterobacterales TaxID=91347 RepID=A0A286S0G8_MORMO|nr:hypothetical protein AOUC001_19295 [Proteus mirabilis]AOS36942.1 hypothetical protein AVM72_16355 [Piscirickettsia salmonis]ASX97903.1 hypothetical protein [Morganella morganii]EAN1710368.1 hypothetical protein [Salmonella enterica]EFH2502732.1 hypothetical protein [Escherichia coli]EFY1419636.1 hypothetical protein [Shigella sonnei]EHU2522924.1 hypothetical protein [Acinetobacter baumannii]EJD6539730.1 hypothetical protein [Providencia rettgeri]EMT95858.1 hypothetical protein ABNIH6_098